MRKRTDLAAEYDRSRRGTGPISACGGGAVGVVGPAAPAAL